MLLLIIALLIMAIAVLLFYQFKFAKPSGPQLRLPENALEELGAPEEELAAAASAAVRKTWFPLSRKFKGYEQRISASNIRIRLQRAGSPIGVLEFFAFKVLTTIFVPVVGMILLGNAFPKILVLLIGLAVGFFLPDYWLNQKIKARQSHIRKELPNVIDLLNLCVSAGLDFMLAVNRVVKDLRPTDLTRELAEVYRQTQMGKSRRDALREFSLRVHTPEVHSFVRTLLQADRMGTPMSEALKMQAEDMRVRRFHAGEAAALKAPIKLLLPLFAFILPVVLILVAGPILIQFSKQGVTF